MTEFELQAIWNSYKVITRIMTFTDIMISRANDIAIPFAHDPDSDPSIEDLDRFISIFESIEEYDSCDRLNKIKNEIQRLSTGNNREGDKSPIYGEICLPSDGSTYWEDFNKPWYLSGDEPSEGFIFDEEESDIIGDEGLRDILTDLFNRSN
jgi:hypothetical protein